VGNPPRGSNTHGARALGGEPGKAGFATACCAESSNDDETLTGKMSSERQIAANRRNAQRSTGPRTLNGKHRSRRNAIRHGLTAETVIGILERVEDYQAFEKAIVTDYAPRSAAEHELVTRLASLMWRLRRATAIESGLLQIQGEILRDRAGHNVSAINVVYRLIGEHSGACAAETNVSAGRPALVNSDRPRTIAKHSDVARCFLRLANLDNGIFERLGRYETRLARQITRTVMLLEVLKTRFAKASNTN
jgi:hypothetical protein